MVEAPALNVSKVLTFKGRPASTSASRVFSIRTISIKHVIHANRLAIHAQRLLIHVHHVCKPTLWSTSTKTNACNHAQWARQCCKEVYVQTVSTIATHAQGCPQSAPLAIAARCLTRLTQCAKIVVQSALQFKLQTNALHATPRVQLAQLLISPLASRASQVWYFIKRRASVSQPARIKL